MANNTKVIFEEIEQRIIKEIEDAHYAIFVSVAWFTNKKLFNALLEKAKNNCYVSIIIQLDEINSQSGIDYSQIEIGRSECFKISKDAELLHDKFCVIDFKKVITGSYNWTYKAAHNSENILILDDPTVATQYISRFEQQKSKYAPSSAKQGTLNPLVLNSNIGCQTTIQPTKQSALETVAPKTKKCLHCKKDIGYDDAFCQYCGRQQGDFKYNGSLFRALIREVTCRRCSRKQEEAVLDANNTKYCTFCGSDNLEWKCVRIVK